LQAIVKLRQHPELRETPIVVACECAPKIFAEMIADAIEHTPSFSQLNVHMMHEMQFDRAGTPKTNLNTQDMVFMAREMLERGAVRFWEHLASSVEGVTGESMKAVLIKQLGNFKRREKPAVNQFSNALIRLDGKEGGANDDLAVAFIMARYWYQKFWLDHNPRYRAAKEHSALWRATQAVRHQRDDMTLLQQTLVSHAQQQVRSAIENPAVERVSSPLRPLPEVVQQLSTPTPHQGQALLSGLSATPILGRKRSLVAEYDSENTPPIGGHSMDVSKHNTGNINGSATPVRGISVAAALLRSSRLLPDDRDSRATSTSTEAASTSTLERMGLRTPFVNRNGGNGDVSSANADTSTLDEYFQQLDTLRSDHQMII